MSSDKYGNCENCNKPVTIPGLDSFLCPSCGWLLTALYKRIYMEEDKRRQERAKLAAAKRKADRLKNKS